MTTHIRGRNSQSRLAARQGRGRLAGCSQQPGVIRLLNGASPDLFTSDATAFQLKPNESGYVERQNVSIEFRWAGY
jgi:hypothetical protein